MRGHDPNCPDCHGRGFKKGDRPRSVMRCDCNLEPKQRQAMTALERLEALADQFDAEPEEEREPEFMPSPGQLRRMREEAMEKPPEEEPVTGQLDFGMPAQRPPRQGLGED